MRRAGPLTAAGLAAAIAAALLVRHQGGGGSSRAPAEDLRTDAGAAAVELREARAPRSILPRRTPGSGEPARGSGTAASGSSVSSFIATHSTRELALLSRFEQLTGRPAPPGLLELVDRRREGVPVDELVALATGRFEGDPLGRAAVLEWLRESAAR